MFISVFAGCLALGPFLFNSDGDLGRHLTLGGTILETGNIPIRDIFSQTMSGQPLSPHEWMAAVIFRLFYDWKGLSGVVLYTSILLGSVFWLISYRVYRNSLSTPITLILIILGIAGSRIHWLARPHIFTYLFLFLWIELLQSRIKFIWKWIISIALMLMWVNTHGAFVTGYVVIGILIAGSLLDMFRNRQTKESLGKIREYLLILITGLLASLINPSGMNIWQTIIGFLSSRYLVSHTAEYMPPVLYHAGVLPFTILVVLGLVLIGISFKNLSFEKILLLIIFAIFGITSGRNIPLYILVAVPILAGGYSKILPKMKMSLDDQYYEEDSLHDTRSILNRLKWVAASALILFFIGWCSLLFIQGLSMRNQYLPEKFPVQAVDWLEDHPQSGNIFNDFGWGGYILYRLWPEQKVFIDGQTDFYGEVLTKDYEVISGTYQGWQSALEKHQIDWILLPVGSKLVKELDKDTQWSQLYRDDTAVILRR